ncbi:hypothetical protein [Bacillus sp. FJAT-27251]|uniref:hypothetical protein n=1 Tax=Bacillus sp. FJAT-27251 TaxID=1684142 RepID=UPI0006A79E32|nr:hypothetical protein [Bacillus sp. FJAT-27251]
MKFNLAIYGAIFALLLLIGAPFFFWYLKPAVPMGVAVIDKTVPNADYREHNGLFWVLEHHKITNMDGEPYEKDKDYYGYQPDEFSGDLEFWPPAPPDLIYLADTYGVYSEDVNENSRGDRSSLLYGGLTEQEWEAILQARAKDTVLLMEFNSIASPTKNSVRKSVEESMSFEWSGWIGRYFPDMQDREIPSWLINNYQDQYQQQWKFEGEGIVFVDENDKVVVLDSGDFDGEVYFQWTKEGRNHYPYARNSSYGYWFDIVEPNSGAIVEANYHVNLKDNGRQILKDHGLPGKFPAVIHHPQNRTYYFAGDYADVETTSWPKWVMPNVFYEMMAFIEPKEAFFWSSYFPMMTQILQEIEQKDK